MKKNKLYFYLCTNGTLLTPLNIVGAQGVVKYRLTADEGKKLTKDDENFTTSIIVPEDEVELWHEVKGQD